MILCSGCFDGLHAGHVRYLQRAAALDQGERLVVAIADDEYVKAVKGRYPWSPQTDRAQVVFALACVDDVTFHDRTGAAHVIRELKPAKFVKGADWVMKLPQDILEACDAVGAEIVFVDSQSKLHSSARA